MTSAINLWFNLPTRQEGDNYFLLSGEGNATKAYSEKSIQREIRSLQSQKKEGEILLFFAPYLENFARQIPPQPDFFWITTGFFQPVPSHPGIIQNPQEWEYFINEIKPGDKFQVVIHPSLRALIPDAPAMVREELYRAARRLKTIGHFQKVWEYNARRNAPLRKKGVLLSPDLEWTPPAVFVLGGPGADGWIRKAGNHQPVWAADTALGSLLYHNIFPDLVFSIDAGYGSREHFCHISMQDLSRISIILDPLSFPGISALPFHKIYVYSGNNPLVRGQFTGAVSLYNQTGDVFGIMKAYHEFLFPEKPLPMIAGRDGGSVHGVTHLRGSAYHRRFYQKTDRINPPENLFYFFSRRYDSR